MKEENTKLKEKIYRSESKELATVKKVVEDFQNSNDFKELVTSFASDFYSNGWNDFLAKARAHFPGQVFMPFKVVEGM